MARLPDCTARLADAMCICTIALSGYPALLWNPTTNRPFILKWSRTWPNDPKKQDFTGRDPSQAAMFARTYLAEDHPDRAWAWFWTVSGSAQIASGYEENARAAARAAEAAWEQWLAAQ